MSIKTKFVTALAFVGVVALTATAFGQSGGSSPTPAGKDKSAKAGRGAAMGKRLVHSESKVQTADGFATVIIDRGDVTKVDGNSVTIKRVDGESVTVTAGADTKVRRNGEQAAVSDLKVGDHAGIIQVDKDGTKTVRAIRAFSPDFQLKARPGRAGKRVKPARPAAPAAAENALFSDAIDA